MNLLVGTHDPAWGHTFLARGSGKVYALRSLGEGSSLCLFDGATMAPLGEFPTPGAHSCHITLLEHQAVVSDYTSGTLSLFPLGADGMPAGEPAVLPFEGKGPHPVRQAGPHIHSSWLSPDGRSLVVVDLGSDKLYRFPVRDGCMVPEERECFPVPAGCGPRHCAFGAGVLYVATELSDEVLVFSWPHMRLLQRCVTNPLRPGGGGHVLVGPGGRYLYVSSRLQNDGIAVFRIGGDGLLTEAGYCPTGAHPRHFTISPDGRLLLVACRDDDQIQLFNLSASDGMLSDTGESFPVSRPVYVEVYEEDRL